MKEIVDTQDYLPFLASFIFFLLGILCAYLYIKIKRKYVGEIEVTEDTFGNKTFTISLEDDPWNLDRNTSVLFKIKSSQSSS